MKLYQYSTFNQTFNTYINIFIIYNVDIFTDIYVYIIYICKKGKYMLMCRR